MNWDFFWVHISKRLWIPPNLLPDASETGSDGQRFRWSVFMHCRANLHRFVFGKHKFPRNVRSKFGIPRNMRVVHRSMNVVNPAQWKFKLYTTVRFGYTHKRSTRNNIFSPLSLFGPAWQKGFANIIGSRALQQLDNLTRIVTRDQWWLFDYCV